MSNRGCSDLVKLTVLFILAIAVVTGGCGGGGGGTVTTGGTTSSEGTTGTTGGATGTVSSSTSAGGQPSVASDAGTSGACVPGVSVGCPCPTGLQGSQTCTASGMFAPCACTAPSVDAGGRYDGDGTPTGEPDASAKPDAPTSTLAEAGADGSEDTFMTTSDPYAGLPAITPSGNSATIGVAGAHMVFPGNIILDVPAGAFTSDTTIQVLTTSQVPPEQAGFGSPLTPIIELLPNGLTFDLPMRLQIAMPAVGINNLMVVSSDPGDSYSQDLALAQGSDGSLQATIWSFSDIGVYGTDWGDMVVLEVPCPSDNNTTAVRGLSLQIKDVFLRSFPGSLVPITHTRVKNGGDPLGMLVQPSVLKQILAALNDPAASNTKTPFQVNSGWRSLAQQYVLSDLCGAGGNSVAVPGDSNHADGSAIDLQATAECLKAAANGATSDEVLNLVHPVWGALLEEQKLIWYGDEAGKTVCGDPPHFDYPPAQSSPLKSASVQAFQTLWNNNNPCAAIKEDGIFGPETELALLRSPVVGWPANPSEAPIQLPAQGAQGAGCQLAPNANGPICCPGASPAIGPPTAPSCRTQCECPTGQMWNPNAQPPACQIRDGGTPSPEDGGNAYVLCPSFTQPLPLGDEMCAARGTAMVPCLLGDASVKCGCPEGHWTCN
jgi:hypothetical protein